MFLHYFKKNYLFVIKCKLKKDCLISSDNERKAQQKVLEIKLQLCKQVKPSQKTKILETIVQTCIQGKEEVESTNKSLAHKASKQLIIG